jgi:hypothetical protein
MQAKFSSLAWREDPLCQILPPSDQESSILPYWLVASSNCWFCITKAYQVIPCLIISWSLIVLPSLMPIPDFVHFKSYHLCSVGSSHGMPSGHFSFLVLPCESHRRWNRPCLSLESLHTLGPSSLCPAWLLSVWRDVVTSKPSHDFLTRCAWSRVQENSTTGLLLTGWQVVMITTLPWIVLVHPGASQAMTCKTERVTPF